MAYKIKGSMGEAGRILIFDESDFSTIEVNEVIDPSGSFDIVVPTSGTKMVIARSASGETIGYGAVDAAYEAPTSATFQSDFTVPTLAAACGYVRSGQSGVYNTTSDITILGGSTIATYYDPWFLITNVNIPQGSTINSAVFKTELRSAGGYSQYTSVNFVNQDNPSVITSNADFFGRPLTTNTTNFYISVSTAGTLFTWPNFANHVQQVIDRPGWVTGNSLLMLAKDIDSQTKAMYWATGYGATNSGYYRPTLTINWTEHYS